MSTFTKRNGYKTHFIRATRFKQFFQGGKKKSHDILISSAGTSKAASPSAPRRELCEAGAFTLDRGLAKHPNIDVGRNRLHSDKSGDT